MKAIHGGTAKHDTIDAQKIAGRLRGGMLPQAYVSPATMRATRDLRRRRMQLAHTRGALLAHVQHTTSQYHRPAIGNTIADKANRDGVAERVAARAVHKSLAVDLARIDDYDHRRRDLACSIIKAAPHHDANTLDLLRTVPGIGKILSLVLLYEIHAIARCPRVQEFAASCRLVTCAKEAAGKGSGTSGTTIGHAHLTWAFSEAAVLCLRDNPEGQTVRGRLEKTHGTGKTLTILAHTLARAVDSMLKRQTAFNMHSFFHDERRGVDELDASRDNQGMNLLLNAPP